MAAAALLPVTVDVEELKFAEGAATGLGAEQYVEQGRAAAAGAQDVDQRDPGRCWVGLASGFGW
jgi:hypothetical protein